MNIHEMFKALDEGKAVKRESGKMIHYQITTPHYPALKMIDFVEAVDYDSFNTESVYVGSNGTFTRDDIEATDWHIYERPKDLPA